MRTNDSTDNRRPEPFSRQAPTTQSDNSNNAYYVRLLEESRKKTQNYEPIFSVRHDSIKPNKIRGKDWKDFDIQIEFDVYDDDLDVFRKPRLSTQEVQEQFAYMTSEARRNVS